MTLTICIHCEHSIARKDPYGLYPYDYVCRVCPLPRNMDYVTGIIEPQYYDLCYNCNKDGQCPKFERKGQDG